MPSKQISDRQKVALAVRMAGLTHANRIARRLEPRLRAVLQGTELMPDVGLLTVLAVRALDEVRLDLVQKDEAHERELDDDDGPRNLRDRLAGELYDATVELREILTGVYGQAGAEAVGLSGLTPRDPVLLGQFVHQAVGGFADATLPPSRIPGVSVQLAPWAERLGGLHKALSGAVADVAREGREAEAALVDKWAAMETFDAVYTETATFLSALLALAGEEELAKRVRPRRADRAAAEVADVPTTEVPEATEEAAPTK